MKRYGGIEELTAINFRSATDATAASLDVLDTLTTSATTVAYTLPDIIGALSSSVLVSTDLAQTLTNKTLTSPSISSPTGITKSDVGLGNVDNTSDATKDSATATLTNKTITTPLGIVKGDVGLGNVDNTSDTTKDGATATLTNKSIDSDNNTITNIVNADIKAAAGILRNKLEASTPNIVPVYDGSGFLIASSVTNTELGYLDGVTSDIQTQFTGKISDILLTTRGDVLYRDATNTTARLPLGLNGQVLSSDGTDMSWSTPAGGGNVSTTTIADNTLVRGDGGGADIQDSGITVSDIDSLSGINSLTMTGDLSAGTNAFNINSSNKTVSIGKVIDTGITLDILGQSGDIGLNVVSSSTNVALKIDGTGAGVDALRIDLTTETSAEKFIQCRTSGEDAFVVKGDGKVGINNSSPDVLFHVSEPTVTQHHIRTGANSGQSSAWSLMALDNSAQFARIGKDFGGARNFDIVNESAGVRLTTGATSWTAVSDIRLKKNIVNMPYGIAELKQLQPICYDLNEDVNDGSKRLGLSAQELIAVIPEVVDGTLETEYGVRYTELIGVLVNAIKELDARLIALEAV